MTYAEMKSQVLERAVNSGRSLEQIEKTLRGIARNYPAMDIREQDIARVKIQIRRKSRGKA